jgi:hypothetical protein
MARSLFRKEQRTVWQKKAGRYLAKISCENGGKIFLAKMSCENGGKAKSLCTVTAAPAVPAPCAAPSPWPLPLLLLLSLVDAKQAVSSTRE